MEKEPMTVQDAIRILTDVQKWSRELPDYVNEVEERIYMPYPLHVINRAMTIAILCMEESECASTVPICIRDCTMRVPTSKMPTEKGTW